MSTLHVILSAMLVAPVEGKPAQEALAKELLVCAGKFSALTIISGVPGGAAETRRFLDATNRIAGADFIEREAKSANETAADWFFSQQSPTLEQVQKSCLPLLGKSSSRLHPED
jgi:hypothetical protein